MADVNHKDKARILVSLGVAKFMDAVEKFNFIADFLRPVSVETPLIRIGAFADGGYVVPNDLDGIAACFSPGVSRQSTFELDIAKHSIPSFMADASCDGPMIDIPGSSFIKKFVGPEDTDKTMSIETWVRNSGVSPDADLLLQMDIEGDEYTTLAAISESLLKRFRMIVLELHYLPSVLTKELFFDRAHQAIEKLKPLFQSVHLHPNNASGSVVVDGIEIPRVVEITLLRKDRVRKTGPVEYLPHSLDVAHKRGKPALKLPDAWVQ